MTTPDNTTSTYHFKAEIKQLLDILVHSLYQDREIFLRELISNASDALTRLHFETLTNANVHDAGAELAIHLETDSESEPKKLIIKDAGVGMTAEELVQNLGTIAQSGAREFLQKMKSNGTDATQLGDVIGQFGVGFYSVFMVADEVRVVSRSYQPEASAAAWVSRGDDAFEVMPASKNDRGTEIHISLKQTPPTSPTPGNSSKSSKNIPTSSATPSTLAKNRPTSANPSGVKTPATYNRKITTTSISNSPSISTHRCPASTSAPMLP